LNIPVVHIEAGERSFDKRMPEEINRLVADKLSDLHFCVSQTAVKHLAREGFSDSVYWVGDVMFDAMLSNLPLARKKSTILSHLGVQPKAYALVTIHRAANTDDPVRLRKIVNILNNLKETVVFPVHPRTEAALKKLDIRFAPNVHTIDPIGYYDMMILEENARIIATDSGGVQREAYFLSVPCLTLRDETEWMETVTVGWNNLVGVEEDHVLKAWKEFSPPQGHPPIFGDGSASVKIASIISSHF
jgi:UDP-N-acetylglucosamine 2-epimerase